MQGHKFRSLQFFRHNFFVRAGHFVTRAARNIGPDSGQDDSGQDEYVAFVEVIINLYHFIAPQL